MTLEELRARVRGSARKYDQYPTWDGERHVDAAPAIDPESFDDPDGSQTTRVEERATDDDG